MQIRAILLTSFALLLSISSYAGHPAAGDTVKMEHPSQPIPEQAMVPSISFKLMPDMMDGYNLILKTNHFNILPPLMGEADLLEKNGAQILQGHAHLYINGEKMMRLYGENIHIPANWINRGINSITVSVNNHMHGTFTQEDREIQSTLIIDTNADQLIKSQYQWPDQQ